MIEHEHQQKCLRINCSTCKNSNRMTKFGGDGKENRPVKVASERRYRPFHLLKSRARRKRKPKRPKRRLGT